MKKVSIIVPCYKTNEEYINRLCNSVFNQSIGMDNLELILVNDGSPDNTFDILSKCEQRNPENVMVVNCDTNGGPGRARSIGINYATGKYVAFIDQDDWVEPYMYEHLVDKAEFYDCDISSGRHTRDSRYVEPTGEVFWCEESDALVNVVDDINNVSEEKGINNLGEDLIYKNIERKTLFKTCLGGGYWTRIYNRDFLLDNRIDFPDKLMYDDNYFSSMLLMYINRAYISSEYVYHWFVNWSSISMDKTIGNHTDRLKVELYKIEEYKRRGFFGKFHDEIEHEFIILFFMNTIHTFVTRLGDMPYEIFIYMQKALNEIFPRYYENKYINEAGSSWCDKAWYDKVKGHIEDEKAARIRQMSWLDYGRESISKDELRLISITYGLFVGMEYK